MEDTYRFWGQKVKGQGHSDIPPSGALSDCVSFLVECKRRVLGVMTP